MKPMMKGMTRRRHNFLRSKPILFHCYFLFLTFVLLLQPLPFLADASMPPGEGRRKVPAALLKWPEGGSPYAVLVDKSRQKVYLYHRDSPFRPKRVYDCSTGEMPGPKTRTNDRRTPEGIYFFTKSFTDRELSPIYGIRAFPIDYPNPIDTRMGRDGYGIWFHGTNKPLKPRDTNGCIALRNESIDELASFIKLYDTPVIISREIKLADPMEVTKEAAALEKIIEGWRKAWESKNIPTYMSYYSRWFHAGDKDWKAWKAYKSRLAKKYRKIRVEIENLRLIESDGVVVASFNQRYRTEMLRSEGVKKLYLQQNSKEWKIVGEHFYGKDRGIVLAARKKTKALSPVQEIRAFLNKWEKSWETKDLKTYISCYDRSFRSRGMNLTEWKRYKERLNRKYRTLSVELGELNISFLSKRRARVSFRQEYRADEYRDVGIKKILLVKKGGHWKIREEKWRPLKR